MYCCMLLSVWFSFGSCNDMIFFLAHVVNHRWWTTLWSSHWPDLLMVVISWLRDVVIMAHEYLADDALCHMCKLEAYWPHTVWNQSVVDYSSWGSSEPGHDNDDNKSWWHIVLFIGGMLRHVDYTFYCLCFKRCCLVLSLVLLPSLVICVVEVRCKFTAEQVSNDAMLAASHRFLCLFYYYRSIVIYFICHWNLFTCYQHKLSFTLCVGYSVMSKQWWFLNSSIAILVHLLISFITVYRLYILNLI